MRIHLTPLIRTVCAFGLLAPMLVVPSRAAAPAGGPGTLRAVDGAGLKKALDSYRGKPVLLNIWATTCGPCVAEFPDLVKVYDTYKAKGLVVIAVSMDEPEDRAKAASFLAKQKAAFPCFIRKSGKVDAFFDPVDKNWQGTMPTTYVFDRSGKMVGQQIPDKMSYAKFAAAVQPVLK